MRLSTIQSRLGRASFTLAIVGECLIILMLGLAVFTSTHVVDTHPSFFIVTGSIFYVGISIHVISFVLGVISLVQKHQQRRTAVAGVVVSGLTLIAVGITMFWAVTGVLHT